MTGSTDHTRTFDDPAFSEIDATWLLSLLHRFRHCSFLVSMISRPCRWSRALPSSGPRADLSSSDVITPNPSQPRFMGLGCRSTRGRARRTPGHSRERAGAGGLSGRNASVPGWRDTCEAGMETRAIQRLMVPSCLGRQRQFKSWSRTRRNMLQQAAEDLAGSLTESRWTRPSKRRASPAIRLT